MVSWNLKLSSNGSNRSRTPIIVPVGEQINIKSVTARVSVIDGTPVPATNKLVPSTQPIPILMPSADPENRVPGDSNSLLESPRSSDSFDCPVSRTKTASRLLNLPPDIILNLSQHLTYNTLLALRSTCHALHTILSVHHLSVIRTRLILNYLADEAMQRAAYRRVHPRYGPDSMWDLFAIAFEWQLLYRPVKELRCYECLEVKPLRMFVERMSSRATGLGGRCAQQRKCKDCMRRKLSIAGIWWREHWLRRSETVRRTARVERYVSWAVRGTAPKKVDRSEVIGVCAECGTGQFELYWGCAGCFAKEQTRRRREEWSLMGIEPPEGQELEGWMRWALEKSEAWRGRRDKRRRQRHVRRAECGGKWWSPRRYTAWMGIDLRWRGSWAERIEGLVDHLEEDYQRRAQLVLSGEAAEAAAAGSEHLAFNGLDIPDHRPKQNKIAIEPDSEPSAEWRPIDPNSLKKDRREARCAMCWTPSCRRRRYLTGLACRVRLDLEKCCEECQAEEKLKRTRTRWRRCRVGDSQQQQQEEEEEEEEDDDDDALEGIMQLFATTPDG